MAFDFRNHKKDCQAVFYASSITSSNLNHQNGKELGDSLAQVLGDNIKQLKASVFTGHLLTSLPIILLVVALLDW